MGSRIRVLVSVVLALVVAMLVTSVAPAGAATVTHESYTFSGELAEAKWFSADEVGPGEPRVAYVMGADAMSVHRVPGAKPERTPQPGVLAMALMREDGPVELWCVSDTFDFEMASDLSQAALTMDCLGEFFTVDPVTGEEVPTGETLELSVAAQWTAIGPLETQRSHSRYTVDDTWTMDLTRSEQRMAEASLTVTSPDAVLLDVTATEATLSQVRAASLLHL